MLGQHHRDATVLSAPADFEAADQAPAKLLQRRRNIDVLKRRPVMRHSAHHVGRQLYHLQSFSTTCFRAAQVLDQQEAEYETELQQLMAAAEAELHGERENTGKLRATLQVCCSRSCSDKE